MQIFLQESIITETQVPIKKAVKLSYKLVISKQLLRNLDSSPILSADLWIRWWMR